MSASVDESEAATKLPRALRMSQRQARGKKDVVDVAEQARESGVDERPD